MNKLQVASGGNIIPGWLNTDLPHLDVTKPLPFQDEEVDFMLASHIVEHLSSGDVFQFFKEAHRVLKKGGAIRICVPSIVKVWNSGDPEYIAWYGAKGWSDGSLAGAVESLICGHGHLTLWTEDLLLVALMAAGFNSAQPMLKGHSDFPELRGVDLHGTAIGEHNDLVESIFVEAVK